MKQLFDKVSFKASKDVTRTYSTSFSLGIWCLSKKLHNPIYAIYGFVRFADEIVDCFHDYDKQRLLAEFKADTYKAIEDGISLNPILNSFQHVVREYNIEHELIDTFLESMEMDLCDKQYDKETYDKYILGSAEVVGLMCLRVFCDGNEEQYQALKPSAMKLGSAFQKINFLRDLQADYKDLGRSYFPGVNIEELDDATKLQIEDEIEADFKAAYHGIMSLPNTSKFGVYVAYVYYYSLFKKIKKTHSSRILNERIRIANKKKVGLLLGSYIRYSFNLL